MSSEYSIKVSNLNKCYQIYDKPHHRLFQMLVRGRKKYFHDFWALRAINFEIKKGQIIGILGKNGAGKSTLLQILCGTLTPTSGEIEIKGRIAALLELGAGFNPEFTGLENVYMNGQILGLTKEKIDSKIKDIQEFADIGDFFYQPVKLYSSGMFARLAFSVSVHVEPDILVIDEALSVGDSWFQHKSMARMKLLMAGGCTVIFVSHSIDSIRALCEKAIWLEKGCIRSYGDVTTVTNQYMNEVFIEHNRIIIEAANLANISPPNTERSEVDQFRENIQETNIGPTTIPDGIDEFFQETFDDAASTLDGGTLLVVNEVNVLNSQGDGTNKLFQGESFVLEFDITFNQRINNVSIGFLIKDQFGQELTGESVFNTYRRSLNIKAGQRLKFRFSSSMLFRGGQSYSVALRVNNVSKWDRSDNVLIYSDELATVFDVLTDAENQMWFKFKQHFDIEVVNV